QRDKGRKVIYQTSLSRSRKNTQRYRDADGDKHRGQSKLYGRRVPLHYHVQYGSVCPERSSKIALHQPAKIIRIAVLQPMPFKTIGAIDREEKRRPVESVLTVKIVDLFLGRGLT